MWANRKEQAALQQMACPLPSPDRAIINLLCHFYLQNVSRSVQIIKKMSAVYFPNMSQIHQWVSLNASLSFLYLASYFTHVNQKLLKLEINNVIAAKNFRPLKTIWNWRLLARVLAITLKLNKHWSTSHHTNLHKIQLLNYLISQEYVTSLILVVTIVWNLVW